LIKIFLMYLDNYINEIEKMCVKHKVKFLCVFGSALTSNFSESSDVDFIVDLEPTDPIDYTENYFALKFQLEDLLKRPVDLLEYRAVRNPYLKKKVNETQKLIYEV